MSEAIEVTEFIRYFVFYMLDSKDWTEHGGGVGASWLTDKGKEILDWIEKHGTDDKAWPKPEE